MYLKLLTFLGGLLTLHMLHAQDSLYGMKMKLVGHSQDVECVAFSSDGKWLATGSWDRNINIYASDTPGIGNLQRTLSGHMATVSCLTFSKDGKYLASGGKDNTVRVWDPSTGQELYQWGDAKDVVTKVWMDAKSTAVLSSSLDGHIRINELKPDAKTKTIKIGSPVNSFCPTPDRRYFFVATTGTKIPVVDFLGKEIKSLEGHSGAVNSIDMSADGKLLVSGSDDKTVIIWDLTTGKEKFVLKGHNWKVTSVQFSYDAKYVVSASNDGETRIWDAETGTEIKTLETNGSNARSIALSPNLNQIAVANYMDATNYGAILYGTPLRKPVPQKKGPNKNSGVAPRKSGPANMRSGNK